MRQISLRVFKFLVFPLLLLLIVHSAAAPGDGENSRMLVRIHLPTPQHWEELKKTGMEARFAEGKKWVDLILTQGEVHKLNEKGFETSVLLTEKQLKSLKLSFDPAYHTYQEMVTELQGLYSNYPDIARMDSIGVSTQEKKIIWALKISDNVELEEDEPAVLYNGVHHACEVMGLEICMRLIRDLLSGYSSDPQIAFWIDNTEIWFIPLLNPDGHSAVTSEKSLYWRKNARDLDRDGLLREYLCNDWWTCYTEGVDLNRNYDFNWEYGGSYQPWHYNYRGEYPFSELETQALRQLALAQRFALSISYHSYGEIVFYPWVWGSGYAPDEPALGDIAFNIASRITKQSGEEPYDYGHNGALAGMSTNWLYGKLGTFDYILEVLPYPFFIPPGHQVQSIYLQNKPGALYLLERVHGSSITGRITDSATKLPLGAVTRILEIAEHFNPPMNERTSEPAHGRYRWLLLPGTYTLEISREGYYAETVSNVAVAQSRPTEQDVSLTRILTGDVSLDRVVDVEDMVLLINYLFKSATAPDPLWVGDVNCSQDVDISDIIFLINYVLKSGPEPCPG
jgi:carboxypeptidase T